MRNLVIVVSVLGTLAVCRVSAAADFYHLGAGSDYLAQGVSPDGQIVVTTRQIWTEAGGFVPLPASDIWARDVSNNGIVVGLMCGGGTTTCYEAFRWTTAAGIQGLGSIAEGMGGSTSDAYAVSADGSTIVGVSSSTDGPQPFVWAPDTGVVGLGYLGVGTASVDAAWGISADGAVIAGASTSSNGIEAFRWAESTGLVGLGDLTVGEYHSEARGISSDGETIVGFSASAVGSEAFRWSFTDGLVGLGDLPGVNS